MNRSINMVGQQLLFGWMILAGGILLFWFCWPMAFKGIVNIGNVCGILGSLLLICFGIWHRSIHWLISQLWQRGPARICLILFAALVMSGIVLMIVAAASILQATSKNIPQNTPAIVLGCSVKGSRPSRILQERIDAAYTYMQQNPQAVCILSGGQGTGEDISEAECMYRALVEAGVDDERLYREAESTSTQENLAYSKKILEDLELTGAVTIISNEFHLYRGRSWANALGYQNYGYAAVTDWRYFPTFFLREIIAVLHLWMVK